ncbi:reverse transcriptase domain-containing protein [Tanacetum coccineum]
MTDIKGISPSYCTHKILIEDNFKLVIQPQRRLNPKVQDVVKNEIVKLLDSWLIYLISDSSRVSPIHVVPKKGGMTVVLNDDNELIPSCTVTGWRRSPATFQRCMTVIFHDMVEDFMEVFMDDFLLFGNSFDCCLANLNRMLARCEETNLVLNWEKCPFMVNEGIVLGHKISGAGCDIEIKDKIGAENLAADHLLRLENPELSAFTEEEIADEFPDEHLMALKTEINDDEPWSEKLDDALWAFRTAYKTPTRCTPFRLVYGKPCHLPVEIEHKAYWALKQCNMDLTAAAKNHFMELNKLIELRDNAYENTQIYKEITKKWHDSRLRGDKDFKVGDLVCLFNSRFKMHLGPRERISMNISGEFMNLEILKCWSLETSRRFTILTTNTPYPSRKIRRIRACTHQRPQRKEDQYVVNLDNSTNNVLLPLDSWTSGLLEYKFPLNNESYLAIRSNILTRETLPQVKASFSIISGEESHRNVTSVRATKPAEIAFAAKTFDNKRMPNNNSNFNKGSDSNSNSNNRGPNPNLKCANCNKIGHTVDRCFELIGYPAGYVKRNFNSSPRPVSSNTASTDGHSNCASRNNATTNISYVSLSNEQLSKLMNLLIDNGVSSANANMAGANQHMTVSTKFLVNVVDISNIGLTVGHPNGTQALITKIGDLKISNDITLYDVLVVP